MYVNKITSVPVNRKTYNDMREKKRASGATERETGRERERERERQTDRQTEREVKRGWILFCFLLSRYKLVEAEI